MAGDEVFFTTGIAASLESLRHQEAVRRDAQSSVVVKAPPAPSLIVTQSQVLLSSPLHSIGEPEDIAGAALLLATDAGRFIIETTIIVDGGATVRGEA